MANEPLIVQAVYSYKRSNNDELNFKKGDVITVTQKDDGWWEGTLNGETGWFPSNYVKECKDAPKPVITQQNQYKGVVLKDLVDSEKAHVTELEGLVTNFLQPLEKSSILSSDEYKQLTGNITEVLETHQQLLNLLEVELSKPGPDQKVGKLFLNWATRIKNVHQAYCSLHPKAVCILDKYKEDLTKYMESKGAASPGVLVLTTMLSKPFRRLDKYSGMLQELERHVEESHPDRGDTQRSVIVYKDIATTCSATRRQKELELQVLTGPVKGWEGPNLTTLGDILYMGLVSMGPQQSDRYFVLFPTTLLILSVSHRLSAFIYEGKLFLSGLTVTRLEDSDQYKNAFEISAPMIDKRIVTCQNKDDADHWTELLKKQMPRSSTASTVSQKVAPSQAQFVPQPPPHQLSQINQRGYCNRTSVVSYKTPSDAGRAIYPPAHYPPAAPFAALTKHFQKLIKSKVITRKLLKRLLYTEYLNKMNLSLVKIRHYKTEFSIRIKDVHCRDSVIQCDSDSDSDTSSDCSDKRSETSVRSSDSSNPFGYIRYYNPRTGSTRNASESGSFVDHGEPSKAPSLKISSATIHLQKQWSEESQDSSDLPQPMAFMACENLYNLNDSLEINNLRLPEFYVPTTRQSCPPKFVGNKFNENSLTAIDIPCWPDSSNTKLSTCSTTTTHSSTLEIPINPVPLPDRVLGELLYNLDSTFDDNEADEAMILKPPSMFDREEARQSISLNLEQPKRRSSLQMIAQEYGDYPGTSRRSPCRCCSQYCHSPRSSDSGMAGSCTLNSPDSANATGDGGAARVDMTHLFDKYADKQEALSLSELIARDFESQCQCTSPFGSTPRHSGRDGAGANVDSVESAGTRKSRSSGCLSSDGEAGEETPVYKTGLYAHWWLKAKIPSSVVRGIFVDTRRSNTGKGMRGCSMTPLISASGTNLSTNHHHRSQGSVHSAAPAHLSMMSSNAAGGAPTRGGWSAVCLRPPPPLRPSLAFGATPNGPYARSGGRRPMSYKEDGFILDVIGAYCSVTKPRSTVNSVELLTGGNVRMHDKLARSHRSSLDLNRNSSSSTAVLNQNQPLVHPHAYRPHQRASTWCCGSFVVRQLKKTQHLG